VTLYYKNISFSNYLSNFNDVAGRVFETPDLDDVTYVSVISMF